MAWYWWVSIAIVVVAIAGFKLWFVSKWMKNQRNIKMAKQRLADEEDFEE